MKGGSWVDNDVATELSSSLEASGLRHKDGMDCWKTTIKYISKASRYPKKSWTVRTIFVVAVRFH